MKTVIFFLAVFIVNMVLSTYAFNDDKSTSQQDPAAASYQM